MSGAGLVELDGLAQGLREAINRSSTNSTEAHVVRALGGRVPPREIEVVRLALEGVQLGWSTEELAARVGLTRAHLSVRLKTCGLPSAGHLLLWAKLLYAGRWLTDPGRSAESIARQLEYSSGAAFRRALHNYAGGTPTEVRSGGGLRWVTESFLDACGLRDTVRADLSVA